MPEDGFIGIGAVLCSTGVGETFEGVTVASLDGIKPCLFSRIAKTSMVEAHEGAHAWEIKAAGVKGRSPGGFRPRGFNCRV